MIEETEILEELQGLNETLRSFPPEAHWFCPRRDEDDNIDYENLDPSTSEDDMSPEAKRELVEDGKQRQDVAYKFSIILALDQEVAGTMLVEFMERLNELLSSCAACIRNWHMGRKAYLKELQERYDEDDAQKLGENLLHLDFHRINKGLKSAQTIFEGVEPSARTQKTLRIQDETSILALFEALCCPEYHTSEEQLSKHFNYVFEHVQHKKPLNITDIIPAMAHFLFSNNPQRLRFARNSWEKTQHHLNPSSFDWVIQDALSQAILSLRNPTPSDLQKFWNGFLLILRKMDTKLITHSLRGMEVQPSIFTLILDHLSSDSDQAVDLILKSLRLLIQMAPKDFWSALGTVSAKTVAEQIFRSAGYHKLLQNNTTFVTFEDSPSTNWIPDFIESQDAIHQVDACRSLVRRLFKEFQAEPFSENVRKGCFYAGLNALFVTLRTFNQSSYSINPSNSLIAINDIVELVHEYKRAILICADLSSKNGTLEIKNMSLLVLGGVLALDCKAIRAEFTFLESGRAVERTPRAHSQSIWEDVLEIFRSGNLELAKFIVAATKDLTGVDELLPASRKVIHQMPKSHVHFNKDYNQLMENISKVFARLSDFSASDLKHLYLDPQSGLPLFAALLSPHKETYEATIGVIKAITDETGKEEAMTSLLDQALAPVLQNLNLAVAHLTSAGNFGPMPHLIKTGGDILKALCGSNGILRARSSLPKKEQEVVGTWWVQQWKALDKIFSRLEAWSPRVAGSIADMQDFCRDAMEYAEALFDKYAIVASALQNSSAGSDDKAWVKKVLGTVCTNINGLTMLLRLRDMYLIGVITSLLGKLLRSLGNYALEVPPQASKYISDACKRENEPGFKKTNLTSQQKAELQRVLYEHQGVEIIEIPPPAKATIKKQATIDSWSGSAAGKMHEPRLPMRTQSSSRPGGTANQTSLSSIINPAKQQAGSKQPSALKSSRDQVDMVKRAEFLDRRKKADEEIQKQKRDAIARAQALRAPVGGSGLKSIGGIVGKDHDPVRNEMMVGSSDEDSDEDDVDDTNSIVKLRKGTSSRVTEYEESKRRALKQMAQGPVKKTKIQRSAKDLRARVEPNMDLLYIEILNWNLFHQGDDPPSTLHCRKIANKFVDLGLYKETFAPLLISEVWRSLVAARDENVNRPLEITILNRLSVDKFMEVSAKMPMSNDRALKFNERDIVLLSTNKDPINNPSEVKCLARVDRTNRKKEIIEVTFRISRNIEQAFLAKLGPQSKVFAVKIADMTTTQREYAALSSLEYYDLCNEVMEAQPSPLQNYSANKLNDIATIYSLNQGQAKAILSAVDNDGFTLIQGPPGSGKTKTIVAMVGALLSQSLQEQQSTGARPQVRGQQNSAQPPKKKLLICAPSNAAVDELVVRLKEGIQPLGGPRQKINVIRLGRSDAINSNVKDVMLDELVRLKLEGDQTEKNKIQSDREKLHQEAGKIKESVNSVRSQLETARSSGDKLQEQRLQREFDGLKRSQAHIGSKIDADKESGNTVSRQNEINRRRFQQEILDGAHVLCATLSGSGHDMFKNLNVEFETVIIDEAAQCIELSALIPLKYGCSKCILVGDPEQLPPTVLSRSAQSFGYEQSLFVRMQKNHPKDVHLLDTQYRMHPEISRFPSEQFYGGKLLDGDGMAKLRDQPWHESATLGPYRFFDVKGVQTKEARGHSFINIPELNAAMMLYARLKADYKSIDFSGKIGIIATYKAQLNELKNRFEARYGTDIYEEVEFNTTDAFQGREREIIIFSCVRATQTGGIGFLKDIRRMNVGLTRAKSSLWVLGDSRSLQQGEFWNKLIVDAKDRDRYTGGDIMDLLSKPTMRDRKAPSVQTSALPTTSRPTGQPPQTSNDRGSSLQRSRQPSEDVQMIDAPTLAELAPTGKRSGEPLVKMEDKKIKSEPSHRPPNKGQELVAALEARNAAKVATASKPESAAPPRPRKKAPVDPFIQKKKPPRN